MFFFLVSYWPLAHASKARAIRSFPQNLLGGARRGGDSSSAQDDRLTRDRQPLKAFICWVCFKPPNDADRVDRQSPEQLLDNEILVAETKLKKAKASQGTCCGASDRVAQREARNSACIKAVPTLAFTCLGGVWVKR